MRLSSLKSRAPLQRYDVAAVAGDRLQIRADYISEKREERRRENRERRRNFKLIREVKLREVTERRRKEKGERQRERNLKLLEKFLDDLVAEPVEETRPRPEKKTKPEILKEAPREETPEILKEAPRDESKQESSPDVKKKTFSIQRFKSQSPPDFFSRRTFEDVGLSEELRKALGEIGITQPSQIQV